MTTTLPPPPPPTLYCHTLVHAKHVGLVTGDNWPAFLRELGKAWISDYRSGEPTAVEMARELAQWEADNPPPTVDAEPIKPNQEQKRLAAMAARAAGARAMREAQRIARLGAEPRQCVVCGAEFMPKQAIHVYCTAECRKARERADAAWESQHLVATRLCAACGQGFTPRNGKQLNCSPSCSEATDKVHRKMGRKGRAK